LERQISVLCYVILQQRQFFLSINRRHYVASNQIWQKDLRVAERKGAKAEGIWALFKVL
jgi:hypothetical protein